MLCSLLLSFFCGELTGTGVGRRGAEALLSTVLGTVDTLGDSVGSTLGASGSTTLGDVVVVVFLDLRVRSGRSRYGVGNGGEVGWEIGWSC